MDSASVVNYHRERMRKTLEEIYKTHPERFPKPPESMLRISALALRFFVGSSKS